VILNDGPGFARDYIEHNVQGTFEGQTGGAMWTFPWVAPATDVGPVTFYVATNMANGDHTNQGDFIFTQSKTISASPSTSGPPVITSIAFQGPKRMFVTGSNFDSGATVFVNDQKTKTRNDDTNPATLLICKKAGLLIDPGTTVNLQVKNSDGTASAVFPYTRPMT
jgi:hypothetical protein